MSRKAKKELTLEERLEQERDRELSFIEDRVQYINEPTYSFNIGDEVIYGSLKKSVIKEVLYDGKVYGLLCTATDNNYGNPYDYQTYRIVAWMDIRVIKQNESNFAKNQDLRINFNNSTIESLIHTYYNFGINMNPNYQRDYVWTMKDKVLLIDSIFNNIEIGKIALIHYSTFTWMESGYGYEILDGKQRLNALIEFYEDRFSYMGKYYSDLSGMDKYTFKNHPIAIGNIEESDKKVILKYFLMLNRTGKVMDQKHLNKVEQMYQELDDE